MNIESELSKSTAASQSEVYYQLALSHVSHIGVLYSKRLIAQFGSAEAVFKQSARDLMQVPGLSQLRAASIRNFAGFELVDKEMELAEKRGIRVLSYLDPDFPQRLNHCPDGPVVLFQKGEANLNARRMISVVGTRSISDYGKRIVRELVESFKPYEITVVSGFAFGVDIHAHRACFEFGLPTIAVLGHGLDRIYPADHKRYLSEVIENGSLLTEFTTGTKPDKENFPMRNRIVAGMSEATIVIESAYSGGSIITADLANGYNRDVFAVPGRIGDERSGGCNRLIKSNRAALLESVKDLEYIMGWAKTETKPAVQQSLFVELEPGEQRIVEALGRSEKVHIDTLSLDLEMAMSMALVHLLNLELKGIVRAMPGRLYQLI